MEQRYLRIEPGTPVGIRLKYPTGKPCTGLGGNELRWILMNGRTLYTPLIVGDQAKELNVKAGERLTILKATKGNKTEWKLTRTTAVAQLLDSTEALDEPQLMGVPNTKPSARLATAAAPRPLGTPTTPLAGVPPRLNGALVEGVNSTARSTGIPTTQLANALKTAVTAAAEAEKHAASIGYVVRFTPADVRAMGISVLIGMQSGGRYAA